jgi:hypothetical protein
MVSPGHSGELRGNVVRGTLGFSQRHGCPRNCIRRAFVVHTTEAQRLGKVDESHDPGARRPAIAFTCDPGGVPRSS